MRINERLQNATKFNPTKKSYQMSVNDLCEKIASNEITLPLYQRDMSWTIQKSIELLNYQLFGKAPVAPISINQINNNTKAVPQISFICRTLVDSSTIKNAHYSVVDGQQRLTTSYRAFIDDNYFRSVVLDVQAAKFKLVEEDIKKCQIPVGVLLNRDLSVLSDYLKAKKTFDSLYGVLIEVRSKMLGYNYTMNIAEDLDEDEQIEWFEVLNNAGSKVTAVQMAFSKLLIYNFDIYRDYVKPFKELIDEFGFDELFEVFTTNVSYPVVALNPAYEVVMKNGVHNMNYAPIPSDEKSKTMASLNVESLRNIVELSLSSTRQALEFIANYGLKELVTRMDYILYLSGYFCFNSGLNCYPFEKLVSWVKNTDFTNLSNGERRDIFNKLLLK